MVSQARGEVSGSGFLNDHASEVRADREGAMAAAGESVYSGPVTPLSASSVSSAAGPMQAQKLKDQAKGVLKKERADIKGSNKAYGYVQSPPDADCDLLGPPLKGNEKIKQRN